MVDTPVNGVVGAAVAGLLSLEGVGSAAFAPARAARPTAARVTAQLQRSLGDFLRARPAFTDVALAVTTPRLAWNGAAGVTARRSQPLSPEAPFRIASVTKTFTSAAILRLLENGGSRSTTRSRST